MASFLIPVVILFVYLAIDEKIYFNFAVDTNRGFKMIFFNPSDVQQTNHSSSV